MKSNAIAAATLRSLIVASYLSGFGSAGLSAVLAVKVYLIADSSMWAAGVYLIQSIASTLFMRPASFLLNKPRQLQLVFAIDVSLCLLSLLLLLTVQAALLLGTIPLLLIKGILEMISRVSKERILKSISLKGFHDIEILNTRYMLANFMGGTSALLLILSGFLKTDTPTHLFAFSAAFLMSAGVVWRISASGVKVGSSLLNASNSRIPAIFKNVRDSLKDQSVSFPFILGFLVISIFQSFNQVSRTLLAASWLEFPGRLAYSSELAGTIAIATTLLCLTICKVNSSNRRILIGFFAMATFVSIPFSTRVSYISLGIFFLYMIAFEYTYTLSINLLLKNVADRHLSDVLMVFDVASMLILTLTGLVFSVITDKLGINLASYFVQLLGILSLITFYMYVSRKHLRRRTNAIFEDKPL